MFSLDPPWNALPSWLSGRVATVTECSPLSLARGEGGVCVSPAALNAPRVSFHPMWGRGARWLVPDSIQWVSDGRVAWRGVRLSCCQDRRRPDSVSERHVAGPAMAQGSVHVHEALSKVSGARTPKPGLWAPLGVPRACDLWGSRGLRDS